MNEFVNSQNRGVELPPGCNDLMDVLAAKAAALKKQFVFDATAASIGKSVQIQNLAGIEKFLRKLLSAPSRACMSFSPTPGRLAFMLLPNGGFPKMLFCFPAADESCRKAVNEIFSTAGIPPIFDGEVPDTDQRILRFPLPSELSAAMKIVTELLKQAYGVSDESGLQIHYVEIPESLIKKGQTDPHSPPAGNN